MTLQELRQKIDAIDTELLRLLNERADVVHEVGVIKKRDGLEIYAPEREDALLKSLVAKSVGRLPEKSIRAIYREIMSAALALEEDLKIAYLGPPGTWTHEASISKFGHSVKYLPQANLADVFDQVTRKEADYGVVPIENSTEGAVRDIFQLFTTHPLKICAEVALPIEICLMSTGELDTVERVIGHPSIIAAVRHWLARQGRPFEYVETSSTAKAAERALADPAAGAVGSLLAAELHGLVPVARQIQDESTVARFSVVGRKSSPPTGNDQTLMTVGSDDMGRSLVDVLATLESLGVETIRVDGHETHGEGAAAKVLIRMEVVGHADDGPVAEAIGALRRTGKVVTILGSYPRPSE